MAKQRKRTNKNVPAKGRLRDMADSLWSLAIKNDWGHKCAVCGRRGDLNGHHLIPREHKTTRWNLRNGITLCRRCHQFDPNISPHQNAAGWVLWLKDNCHLLWFWYTETTKDKAHQNFLGTLNAPYYCEVIKRLEQYVKPEDFVRIVGIKFSAWLSEQAAAIDRMTS